MMCALPFVPVDIIPTVWRHLKPLIPRELSSFVDYYEYTWVGSSNRNPTFSHYRWNQHDATTLPLPQSSSIAEGWHHPFRSMLSCQNPSIWKFLECLKKEQSLTEVKMTKMMMREEAEPRLAKWRRYDERLQRIIMSFNDYSTFTDYLRCISNLVSIDKLMILCIVNF